MVYTNQLIAAAFTLISNFANVARIPLDQIPRSSGDLQHVLVGSPRSPLDLYLVSKHGDEFWTHDGIVEMYTSVDTYFLHGSRAGLERFLGPATINSNQAVAMATKLVQRLARSGDPLRGAAPNVRRPYSDGFHFYRISWPVTNYFSIDGPAAVEIDGRTGRPLYIALWDPSFYDPALAEDMRKRLYRPDPVPPHHPPSVPGVRLPSPSSRRVAELIPKWLSFCHALSLDPGPQTRSSDVDRSKSIVFTNTALSGEVQVRFKNGTVFEAMNGKIFAHFSAHAAFVGAWAEKPEKFWEQFGGSPTNKWEDLSGKLNSLLVSRLGVSQAILDEYTPLLYVRGTGGMSRCIVRWCDSRHIFDPPDEVRTALFVEFDLQSGTIETIRFDDPRLLEWKKQSNP